jgi:glyoxylase-like metal-dependent hydrolase (beta-lactamase superfamily II)
MKLSNFTGGIAETNGYLLETPDGNLLIDAPEGVSAWLEQKGVRVDHVLLTHQHYDHVLDAAVLQANGTPLHAFAHHSRQLTLEEPARTYGMPISVKPYQIHSLLTAGSVLKLAGLEFEIAHVPGHSVDSLTFYFPAHGIVFSGDTLFAGSVGRTDLPGGNTQQLLSGIAAHLLTLPPETRVFSGHGPASSIGREISVNSYLK